MPKLWLIFFVIIALFHAAQGKKCCNYDCTQVISQGRSFREYIPTEQDGLHLERDVKVWVFMKEMGVNEEGDEMWFGESRGKRGYFPKHLIGEYMVLCRELMEIREGDLPAYEPTDEKKREDITLGELEMYKEEGYESDSEIDTQESTGIPDLVSEWRMKASPSESNQDRDNIADFHAPDTDAMQSLKKQMDDDFLNRILEAEGVDRIDEVDPDRITEIIQDPGAASIVLEALQELSGNRDREMSHGDFPAGGMMGNEYKEVVNEDSREISPPDAELVDTSVDDGRSGDDDSPVQDNTGREISHLEVEPFDESVDDNLKFQDDTDREISHPDIETFGSSFDDNLPLHDNTDHEISQPDNSAFENTDSVDIPEDIIERDSYDETREILLSESIEAESIEHEQKFSHFDQSIDETTDQETIDEVPCEISHPGDPDNVDTSRDNIFGIIPSPLSVIIREYINTYGLFYIIIYTLIPLVITHLYVGRRNARNKISAHKIKTASHVRTLEQKVASLQKEKKAVEARIAKFDTLKEANAASQEELNSLRINFDKSKQELAGNSQYISRLENQAAQLNGDLQVLQERMSDQCSQVSRLETLNTSAQEEILSLNAKINLANEDIQQADTDKITLQLRLDANIDSFAKLKEKLNEVEKSRDEAEQKKNRLQDDLRQREATNFANSERIHTLEGEIEVLTNSLLKLQPKGMGNSTTTDTEKTTIFETLTNTAKALSELEQATVSRDKFERLNQILTTENAALKARTEDLDDNLSCLKSSNILLKKQLGDSDTKLQVLNEYFNTKESELHRQLNESRNSQILLEGKDHRSVEEIDSVRSEREALKTEVSALKQQHSLREKSLLEQIVSLEKRAQDSLYSSRRSEQELRGRDREITELKRKLGESSLPSSQTDTYLSPRSTSPSSQLSSNSDTEARGDKNRGTQSPSQAQFASTGPPPPTFTSGPPTRNEIPPTVVASHVKPSPLPGYLPGYMPSNFYRPAPYPPMMAPFPPRPIIPQNMHHFNSPTVPLKHRPQTKAAVPIDEPIEVSAINSKPPPGLYAPSPPTLIDTSLSNEYMHLDDSSQGSLLDSQNHSNAPPMNESSAFKIDV